MSKRMSVENAWHQSGILRGMRSSSTGSLEINVFIQIVEGISRGEPVSSGFLGYVSGYMSLY